MTTEPLYGSQKKPAMPIPWYSAVSSTIRNSAMFRRNSLASKFRKESLPQISWQSNCRKTPDHSAALSFIQKNSECDFQRKRRCLCGCPGETVRTGIGAILILSLFYSVHDPLMRKFHAFFHRPLRLIQERDLRRCLVRVFSQPPVKVNRRIDPALIRNSTSLPHSPQQSFVIRHHRKVMDFREQLSFLQIFRNIR